MEFRTIDGSGNNLSDPAVNAVGAVFDRIAGARYADGIHALASGPNARSISNLISGEGDAAVANNQGLSGMMYAWGQFIDHDLTRTPTDGVTHIDVVVPAGDAAFTAGSSILVTRGVVAAGTGVTTPAQFLDRNTGWLDGSVVYGSDATVAAALRGAGGKMAVSAGDNLPLAQGRSLAGDVRAQENPSLTALQTIFVREHNLQVDRLAGADATLDAEALYEGARAIVTAEIARITYSEFLPHLLGPGALPDWRGYDPTIDASLTLEFTGAAYRWGHSTVSAETVRRDEAGAPVGHELDLRDAFFLDAASFVVDGGAGGFLRHLGSDQAQAMDGRIVEDLRSFLFNPGVGQDLAAINIQRGRDLGLTTLNETRAALGLSVLTSFEQITSDPGTLAGLQAAYADVADVELWVGGLAERLVTGAFLGETFQAIVAQQFLALRDGDRLWYQNQGFDAATLAGIEASTLSAIILRTTDTQYYQADAFLSMERRGAGDTAESPNLAQLVIGTGDGQTLNGSALGDILAGRDGDQLLQSFGGADTLYGGAGDDTLSAGAGNDVLWGEDGADTAYGGMGDDVVRGADGQDQLHGDTGQDTLAGGAAADTLWGDGGHDLAFGEAGADALYGGAGRDTLYGGDGDDTISADAGDDVANGGAGDDVVAGREGHDRLWGEAGDDVLFGEAGDDTLYGGDGADTAYGGEGADAIAGGAGDDALAGGAANDAIYGGAGADALFGQEGDDTLEGGAGADWLLGGDGADLFRFGADAADGTADWIGDFSRAEGDGIDLTGIGQVTLEYDAPSGNSMVRVSPMMIFGVSSTGPLAMGDFIF